MLLRAAFLYVLFVAALLSGGFAVWQSLEVRMRDEKIADVSASLLTLRRDLQSAEQTAASMQRRALVAEHDLGAVRQTQGTGAPSIETLRTEVAAAKQQVSAAETAVTETETRLADEIAAHAALKAQAAGMAEALAQAERELVAAEAKAEKAVKDLADAETRMRAARLVPSVAAPAASPPVVVPAPLAVPAPEATSPVATAPVQTAPPPAVAAKPATEPDKAAKKPSAAEGRVVKKAPAKSNPQRPAKKAKPVETEYYNPFF